MQQANAMRDAWGETRDDKPGVLSLFLSFLNTEHRPVRRSAYGEGGTLNTSSRPSWPKSLPDQVRLVRELLAVQAAPVTAETLAKSFTRARVDRIEELLQTLVTLGQARQAGDGKYSKS